MQLYRNCLNKDPNNVAALNNLAWNLTQQENPSKRDIAEALQLAKRAAQLTGNGVATILDTLAQAQLRAGHKTNSIDTLKRAAQLAKRSRNQEQYDKIQSMIEKLRHSK